MMHQPTPPKQLHLRSLFNRQRGKRNHCLAFLVFLLSIASSYNGFAQSGPNASVISCPANIVKTNEPGSCGAHVTFSATITDDQAYTLVYSKPSGAMFPIGTTNVEVKALDINGATIASCSFDVTIVDNEAPKLSGCPSNITTVTTNDICGAIVNYTKPAVADACTTRSKTFNFSGSQQTFIVPEGVNLMYVDISGASGGHVYSNGSTYGQPGFGGQVKAIIPVVPGQILYINVGGAGKNGTATAAGSGGFNGGADGGVIIDNTTVAYAAGGGGGASDIRTPGTALTDRIMVAGGGGANGILNAGGNGGDLKGQDGAGGTAAATGGTESAGGTAGNYANFYYGINGSLGLGGAGSAEAAGGGGGGGFFGGGGGSLGSGAGGSSYAYTSAKNVYHIQGSREGNGSVTLIWSQPATLVQTQGLPSGSVFPVGTTINTFTATDAAGNAAQCSFSVTVTDNQKPVLQAPATQFFNANVSEHTVPALVATDNCGIGSVTFTITGTTLRSGTGTDASGSFNPGYSVITWTVTDTHGNVENALTSVNVISVSLIDLYIPDVYAVSPGGKPNTVYVGYGPSSISLNASVKGGTAPYSYRWSLAGKADVLSESQTLQVFSAGEYEVTVTDVNGDSRTVKKSIQMVDVRCGNNNEKVVVCQAGKVGTKSSSVCIKQDAVAVQLAKGGILGDCSSNVSGARLALGENPKIVVEANYKVDVFPNPTTGIFSVQLTNFSGAKAEVMLLSANGVTIQKKTVELTGATQRLEFNINNLNTGVYFVKVISDNGTQTEKVMLLP